MSFKELRLAVVVWLMAATLVAADAADPAATRRDAETLKRKIATIVERETAPARRPTRTTVTEREVNAYLVHEAQDDLPTGVMNPSVTILGTGRVSGRAVVDLDKVREARKATSPLDPRSYLTGRLPVAATGIVQARNGVARFQLESADIAGVPIPKVLLQQIVAYYSRSAAHPSGIRLDDPVVLPARIREIHIERGRAVIIQ